MPGPVAEYVAQYTPEGIQRKLEQIGKDASAGSGSWFELYQQNLAHAVEYWISQTPQPELKERIRSAAIADGAYQPNPGGRWVPDIENNDLEWRPEYRPNEADEISDQIGAHMRKFITGAGYKTDDIHIPDEIVMAAAAHAKTEVSGERAATIADYMAFDTTTYNSEVRANRQADLGFGYRNEAVEMRERLERLTAEREGLHDVLTVADSGDLASPHVPSDIHTYYGRVRKIDNEIAAAREEAGAFYERAMQEVRTEAARDERWMLQRDGVLQGEPETRESLRDYVQMRREAIAIYADNMPDAEISPWLSNDDFNVAYRQGANAELAKWYWEQKREHGLGNAQKMDGQKVLDIELRTADRLGVDRDEWLGGRGWVNQKGEQRHMEHELFVPSQKFVLEQLTSLEKDLKRAIALTPDGPNADVYATASTNHFRGRATEWNSWREAIINHNPSLEKDLPEALVVDEIQVRRQVLEQEHGVAVHLGSAR